MREHGRLRIETDAAGRMREAVAVGPDGQEVRLPLLRDFTIEHPGDDAATVKLRLFRFQVDVVADAPEQ